MEFVAEQDKQFHNRTELCINEKVLTKVYDIPGQVSQVAAERIKEVIEKTQEEGRACVLGLATGSTPCKVYALLCGMFKRGEVSFRNVHTFNLDEYYPMGRESRQSYYRFMQTHLFSQVDIPAENIHIPDGECPYQEVEEYCRLYEENIARLGGIDLQLLGIGKTGHIGFNEPGSQKDSRTRMVYLDKITKADAASDFYHIHHVPRKAITMGVGSILAAKEILILAFGEGKAKIVRTAIEGPVSSEVPASYLQQHQNCTFLLDSASSALLTRFSCPWTLRGQKRHQTLLWDGPLTLKAVIWLSESLSKSILTLTQEDYEKNGLYSLLDHYDLDAERLNRDTAASLMATISDKPCSAPLQKVLIFSPHPDDDVICMGGTMQKMVQQGHEVHVCYQTSGSIGVFDHDVAKYNYFLKAFLKKFQIEDQAVSMLHQEVEQALEQKQKGEANHRRVLDIKGLIREGEAVRAAVVTGVKEEHVHFLNMPFYETGTIQKGTIGDTDVRLVKQVISEVQPHQIYMAGDLTDPHGTHRQCSLAVVKALQESKFQCRVLMYRGAWQEWEVDRATLVVPLTPNEVQQKKMAIFKHQSQKDMPLFPGSDNREFWQRAYDRNRATAVLYNQLGMPEYHSMEVFVDLSPADLPSFQ